MNTKETINLIAYAIKKYHDEETNRGFSLLEYYSITDVSPRCLAREANKKKMCSQATTILNFLDMQYWNTRELNMEQRFKHYHAFNGTELTNDDKLSIFEKISGEGYPLIDGVYDRAAYNYANNVEYTKEVIKNKIINAYNQNNPNAKIALETAKVKTKTMNK